MGRGGRRLIRGSWWMGMSKKRSLHDMVGRNNWPGLIFWRSGICVWLLVYVGRW